MGFYANRRACVPCEDSETAQTNVQMAYIVAGTVGTMLLLVCVVYIASGAKPAREARRKASVAQGSAMLEHARRRLTLLSLVPRHLAAASTMFRVLLGYCQCMAVLLTFDNVTWPRMFVSFIEVLEVATVEIFALVPAECSLGTR
jgi:hypothetical protein